MQPGEAELRYRDRQERMRQYSYDLTKQLTFFVISAELVFCGYILLNAKTIGGLEYSSVLFVLAGLAVMLGIAFRFFYNEIFHAHTHSNSVKNIFNIALSVSYFGFVTLSLVFFVILLIVGYAYLSGIEDMVRPHATGY